MSHIHSLLAYHTLAADGTLSRQQREILDLLADGKPRTSRQIAKELDMERTSVTGRITALKNSSTPVLEIFRDVCPDTNKAVEFYRAARI